MNAKKWIIAGMTAALFVTGGNFAAQAATADVKVVVTSPDLANMPKVRETWKQLAAEGYQYIKVSRSMLGRAVIYAWDGAKKREIVINMTSGDIMQDATEAYQGYPAAAGMVADNTSQAAGSVVEGTSQAAHSVIDSTSQAASSVVDSTSSAVSGMVDSVTGGGGFGFGN